MTISKITDEENFDAMRYGDHENGTLIEDTITGDGRWVDYHYVVWSETHDDGVHYFGCSYETPSTEAQEGSEADFDADEIEEVFPQAVTVIKYYNQKELDLQAARAGKL